MASDPNNGTRSTEAPANGTSDTAPARTPKDNLVVTHHETTIQGKTVAYTVTTGTMVLTHEKVGEGEKAGQFEGVKPRAEVFFVAYELDGQRIDVLPFGADAVERCVPIYEDLPGWSESTAGLTRYEQLPLNARRYIERFAEVAGAPIDIVSTGPDRDETILIRHPFS